MLKSVSSHKPAMRKSLGIALLILASVFFFSACGNDEPAKTQVDPEAYKDPLVKVNKELVKKENAEIDSYIARYQWNMQKSGTGLRYLIYEKGSGTKADTGMRVEIRFKVNLINGQVVYDSKTDGMKTFVLGKAEVESGLEEGIMLMKAGDKAKLIIPSHLAYGLLGDENKIPKRATLVYDVELVSVYR